MAKKRPRKPAKRSGSNSGRVRRRSAVSPQDAARVRQLLQDVDQHRLRSDPLRAADSARQVLAIDPDCVPALFALSQCVARMGHIDQAISLGQRAVQLERGNAMLHAGLADLHFRNGDLEASEAAAREAIRREPRLGIARQVIGRVLGQRGEYDEAIEHLKQSGSSAAQDPLGAVELAHFLRLAKRLDEAASTIEPVLARNDLPIATRAGAAFEAGMIFDALGRYDEAFACFERNGELTAKTPRAQQFDLAARRDMINDYRRIFTPERLQRVSPDAYKDAGPAPAFLVGFPRSGTTMMEQVLDAHPQLVAAPEPPYFVELKRKWTELAGSPSGYEEMVDALDEPMVRTLRQHYWDTVHADLGSDATKDAKVFLHKHPLLINELGVINAIFPDARVLVALRDPRDCCLSCFIQDFELNISMVHFLTMRDTAALYRQTFDFYFGIREHLSVRTLEIRYEDTVEDLESQARKVLEFFGLPWDPVVLSYHERALDKFISTPSAAAVRQPVYKTSMARWRRYENHITPFLDDFKAAIDAFGYDA